MTNVLLAVWSATTVALVVLVARAYWRLVLVARASHELRGPLCAVQLGLEALDGDPSRVAAIDLELRRAGRALEDLAAARSGGRARSRAELVELGAFAAALEPAWRALA